MSLETEVQALTQATTELLKAVNVRKSALDGAADTAVAAAASATAKADLLGNAQTTTATGTVTLTSANAVYQFINPNGAARDVVLPNLTAPEDGRSFCIKNVGTAGNALTVKNAANAVIGFPVGNGFALTVIWTGTAWEAI